MERENSCLEYKETVTNRFLKTVSAYANYGPGKIIFGVNDNGVAVGINNLEEACLQIENKINDCLEPVPQFSLEVNNDEKTITLFVQEGIYKPYLSQGKAYKRSDSSTVQVDRLEYGRLILEGQNITYDQLPTTNQQFTFAVLEKALQDIVGIEQVDTDILRTLGLLTNKGQYTNAAALLADANSFPGIDIVRFGETINEFLDRKKVIGVSVLSQINAAMEKFETYYCLERIEGAERKRVELVPLKAFREALANALVHRAWDISANISIAMYKDRIEITSPGGLPSGITEDEYLNKNISLLRNPTLANVFFRLNYIEQFGTGISRIKQMYNESLRKPSFEIRSGSICVCLPIIQNKTVLTTDQAKVYQVMSEGKLLSRSEIEALLGFTKDKTIRLLNELETNGSVERQGKGRGTRYRRI